ncbi:MAG: DUF3786 domain-containing protein [Candidatus Omnitrophica bacterium]|nr:DUF3786 domain-containing protein [Candidatus Omnitrophota bacterium]MCM8808957.1 DUF3786 domain-containing protein [Candidatus Omnitrophota bacterium]MCM8810242.1 DUF3786 domain-containing protein [Candidatus Omnitrophota bacterium]MCM8833148.1 DUF3786 domain-containing protein [Candidatus Omnitrophota bacterium]
MKNSYVYVLDNLWKEISEKLEKRQVKIIYFGKEIEIDLNSKNFKPELETKEKILILHYLLRKKTEQDFLNDEIISFKELNEGPFYFPSIYSRVYLPLIERYSENPEKFVEKGISIGGQKISNFKIKFEIFPEIYYILELIPQDDEFPADIKIFFNKKASEIFEIEDLAIIGELIVSKM